MAKTKSRKRTNESGYIEIRLPDESWILEHRYVMMTVKSRKLGKNEHVHHIDGNKTNNDPKNLRVLTEKEHDELHKRSG